MKYGALYFKDTLNIGDDIQTYVSLKYLPKIDYYIDRENMDKFVPDEKEEVAVITNGWFIHNTLNFPPSPYIKPLPISMHFSLKHVHDIKDEYLYLEKYSIDYLKSIEPIMCRDSHTTRLLAEKGVKTEYSGCMTLTLNKFKDVKKEDYIVALDISDECLEKLKSITDLEIKVETHQVDESYSKLSISERLDKVEKLLKLYQGAKYIVTTRLHVSLPATALGTKTLIIYDEDYNNDRFSDFVKYINCIGYYDFLKEDFKIDFDDNKVGSEHMSVVNYINGKCSRFISYMENYTPDLSKLPDLDVYTKYGIDKVNEYKKACLRIEKRRVDLENKYRDVVLENNNISIQKDKEIEELKNKLNIVSSDLNAILNRKMYKVLNKGTDIIKIFKRK